EGPGQAEVADRGGGRTGRQPGRGRAAAAVVGVGGPGLAGAARRPAGAVAPGLRTVPEHRGPSRRLRFDHRGPQAGARSGRPDRPPPRGLVRQGNRLPASAPAALVRELRRGAVATDPHRAFLDAILEAPEDDAVRLIYADWLEEQGDPRGEFIR